MKELQKFVSQHRSRFIAQHDNTFAFSWGKVFRRWLFLETIENRHAAASAALIANTRAVRDGLKGSGGRVPLNVAALLSESPRLNSDVHLEIESYYLFAKILLDDVARGIEYYFGPVRGLALDSHDDLARCIVDYASAKKLRLSDELVAAIHDLKTRVCDYRDQYIAHEKSPRTLQGTSWIEESGTARIVGTRLYPRETDPKQSETEELKPLRASLESYLDKVAGFLSANEAETNLQPKPGPKSAPKIGAGDNWRSHGRSASFA